MKRISRILFLICVFVSLSANAQLSVWENHSANQEVGYAGRGNTDELLVTVCHHQANSGKLTVTYELFGSNSDGTSFNLSDYVGKVKLYARKRDTNKDYKSGLPTTFPDRENIFAKPYEFYDVKGTSTAILLAAKPVGPNKNYKGKLVSKSPLAAGDYLIYLSVDITNFDLDKLPPLTKSITRIGGEITAIGNTPITEYLNSGNKINAWGDGGGYQTTKYPGGSKAIIPAYTVLFRPGDGYAKYYSTPAIATTADGTILAVTEARKLHAHDLSNDIDILARRSMDNGKTWEEPFAIFKGSAENSADAADCQKTHGFSCPSVVTFNDGTVMVCAIADNGIEPDGNFQTKVSPTYVVYRVSDDNGKTWGEIQEVDPLLFGGTKKEKYMYRGRIASGQFFVAQKGCLKGKAVCCLRTVKTTSGNDHKGIHFLYYDHISNKWNSIKKDPIDFKEGTYPAEDSENDEAFLNMQYGQEPRDAQIIETGENRFLISMSDKSQKSRSFWNLKVARAEVDGRSIIYSVKGGNTEFQSSIPIRNQSYCNGGILKYKILEKEQEKEVLLLSMPRGVYKQTGSDASGLNEEFYSRTSLCMYTTPVPAESDNNINWSFLAALSDSMVGQNDEPADWQGFNWVAGGLAECAQISSITQQRDRTIGVMYEGYPIVVRHDDHSIGNMYGPGGNWIMAQYYLNLRIGDMYPDVEPEEPKECAFQTRVNTNFNGGKKFNYNTDAEYQENDCPTFYSYWSSNNATGIDNVSILKTFETNTDNCTEWLNNGEREGQDFVLTAVGANEFSAYDSNQPGVSAGTLKYTDKINNSEGAQKRQFRLDAYPTILPDAFTATDFNAVVVCKVGDKYLTDNTGKIKYYVINGKKRPYGIKSNMSVQSAGVYEWWELNKNNNVTPKCVGLTQDTHSGMLEDVFYRPLDENGNIPWLMENGKYVLDAKGNKQPDLSKTQEYRVKVEGALNFLDIQKSFPAGTHPKVVVEFYITGNNNASVDKMLSAKNYLLKVNHPIVYDETFTDVEEIENGMSESESRLTVAAAEGGATFTGEQMNVSVYNVMGMLVKNFYLDGVQFVELPQGIYIANGQKFIVR